MGFGLPPSTPDVDRLAGGLAMRMAQPFVELLHELTGRPSAFNRASAEALRLETPPRSMRVARAIAALHAPWWGFAVYGVLYAMSVMALGAALAGGVVQAAANHLHVGGGHDWTTYLGLGAMVSAPLTALPFRVWMRRRRHQIVEVARSGELATGWITEVTTWKYRGGTHSTQLTVATGDPSPASFHGFVPRGRAWAVPGHQVELVRLSALAYAILLCPDGGTRPLRRAGPPPGDAGTE